MAGEGVTRLLGEMHAGRAGAMDDLMHLVEEDLRRIAASQLAKRGLDGRTPTLDATALVSETYLRLLRQRNGFVNRDQFFALTTRIMLRVLADHQRARLASKRHGPGARITLSALDDVSGGRDADPGSGQGEPDSATSPLGRFEAALEALEAKDPRKADVVKLRVVWGLELDEIAASLGVSAPTVDRDWRFARAWILERMQADAG